MNEAPCVNEKNVTAVIMAGGKGTRIAALNSTIPKPLLPVAGKPVLEHEIECLKQQGITKLVFTVSHMAEQITEHFEPAVRCIT